MLKGEAAKRAEIIAWAKAEIGVRESSGNNDGARVEEYLGLVNLPKGYAWCAAFVSWVFAQAGYASPRSAWSPALFPPQVRSQQILPANIFGIYFKALKRIAHVGIVVKREGDWILGIEGNTQINGSRDGDGVYQRRRHRKTIYLYADWLNEERLKP
ncbi:peptidoglycan-binding protein [Pseudoxanthomonas sp. SGD-10]|nr:peptidoglycan-binding protein [Pseudoxanthomonas sp. SGD-10]